MVLVLMIPLVLWSTHHLPFGHVIFKLVFGPLLVKISSDEIYFLCTPSVKSHTINREEILLKQLLVGSAT
jgi:hypothetical protein